MCSVLLCTSPQANWALLFGEWAQHIIKLYLCLIIPIRATAKTSSRSQAIHCCFNSFPLKTCQCEYYTQTPLEENASTEGWTAKSTASL